MEISSLSLSPTVSLSSIPKPAISASKSSSSFLTPTSLTRRSAALRLSTTRVRPGSPTQKRGFSCNAIFGLGVPEIAVIAGVAVLVFGPKQIPEIGRSIGKTVKGFQQAAKEFESEIKKPVEPSSADGGVEAQAGSGNSEEGENVSVS